jgi:hypothetical protein
MSGNIVGRSVGALSQFILIWSVENDDDGRETRIQHSAITSVKLVTVPVRGQATRMLSPITTQRSLSTMTTMLLLALDHHNHHYHSRHACSVADKW